MKDGEIVTHDGEAYCVLEKKHLRMLVPLWLNGYLPELKLRSLGTGSISKFTNHIVGPMGISPNNHDIVYGFEPVFFTVEPICGSRVTPLGFMRSMPDGDPLYFRVNGSNGFDNRLEYSESSYGSEWSIFVTDACVQVLIPATVANRF